MKWILAVFFLTCNLMAESALSELPADVQNEIKTTESVAAAAPVAAAVPVTEAVKETEPIVDKKTAKENEIPLSLETTKKIASNETTYFRIILVIALLGILACGTWVFVRKAKTQNIKRNKNEIKVLAQHYLGPKKSMAVVRVAGESILVGITDTQINMIKTLSLMDDELPEVTSQNFRSELDTRLAEDVVDVQKQAASTYNRKSQINTKTTQTDEEMDEFSIKGIKDLVSSKLKNMRSI
ncbi:MAG: flagellar biosynthetic protein FliO [Bdellovibrionaceae bacterium]|nr:flagellar biosynthetic protein FliO [Pseudobdellovibrionaceae bacterium]